MNTIAVIWKDGQIVRREPVDWPDGWRRVSRNELISSRFRNHPERSSTTAGVSGMRSDIHDLPCPIRQVLRSTLGDSPEPLAIYVDEVEQSTVRYELFSRLVFRTSTLPCDSHTEAIHFMSGFEANPQSIFISLGLSVRDRSEVDKAQLDEFLSRTVSCVEEFERLAIPVDAPMATPGINDLFFKTGQEFVTRTDLPVRVHVEFHAPASGGGNGCLPAGVRIRVIHDSADYTQVTYCEVLESDYSKLERSLVPKFELTESLYAGYSLSIENILLRDRCLPIEEATHSEGA